MKLIGFIVGCLSIIVLAFYSIYEFFKNGRSN
jgi:hypothetical protein